MTTASQTTQSAQHPDENWDNVKARLQQRWGQIDSGDFESSSTWDDVLSKIQHKTGETRQSIEEYATKVLGDAKVKATDWQLYAKSLIEQAKTKAANVTSTTGQTAQQYTAQAQDSLSEQLHTAENAIRSRPLPSIAYAFGLGALVGVMLGTSRR